MARLPNVKDILDLLEMVFNLIYHLTFGKSSKTNSYNVEGGWFHYFCNMSSYRKLQVIFTPSIAKDLDHVFKETEKAIYDFYELCK